MEMRKIKGLVLAALAGAIMLGTASMDAEAAWVKNSAGKLCYTVNSAGTLAKGWLKIGNYWYYFNNDGSMRIGWLKDAQGNYYYLQGNGRMRTGWTTTSKGAKYFFNASGVMQTGWYYDQNVGKWYYFNEVGVMQTGMITVNDKLYYMNAKGQMTVGSFIYKGNQYYAYTDGHLAVNQWLGNRYYKSNGAMAKNEWVYGKWVGATGLYTGVMNNTGWIEKNGSMYYYNSKGTMVKGLTTIGGKSYYFNPTTGVLQYGWIKIGSVWYYADKSTGAFAVNSWVDNKTYYVGSNGAMYTGLRTIGGNKYYFDLSSGAKRTGWVKSGNYWFYFDTSTGAMKKNTWIGQYYVKANGIMATGLTKIGKYYYYFDASGAKRTGWVQSDKTWYYFNTSGIRVQNTWVDNKYYMGADGKMATGVTRVGAYYYYFDLSNGHKRAGWVYDSPRKAWYYGNSQGILQRNTWVENKNYYMLSNGKMVTGWRAINGKLYYFDLSSGKKKVNSWQTLVKNGVTYHYYLESDGAAAAGKWKTINGKMYAFRSNGIMYTNTWVGQYYVGADGAKTNAVRKVGLTVVNGKTYCYDSDYNMIKGFYTIDGKTYYFGKDGVMVTGKQTINKKKYYFQKDGTLLKDTKIAIGSTEYTIDRNGVITNERSYTVSGNTRGAKIVNYAIQFVGNPYVYGGIDPVNGADCSGFVYTVFKNFGIQLMRVADDQMHGPTSYYIGLGYKEPVVVPIDEIKPGDLLFYGANDYASHVAIYIGNGQIVHASNSAPYPTGGIKYSAYNYSTPIKAVRYWS